MNFCFNFFWLLFIITKYFLFLFVFMKKIIYSRFHFFFNYITERRNRKRQTKLCKMKNASISISNHNTTNKRNFFSIFFCFYLISFSVDVSRAMKYVSTLIWYSWHSYIVCFSFLASHYYLLLHLTLEKKISEKNKLK